MAAVVGHPGQSAKTRAYIDFFSTPMIFGLLLLIGGPILVTLVPLPDSRLAWIALLAGMALGLYLARKSYAEMFCEMRGAFRWARGADGEDKTAAALAQLPEDCIVIHDFHPLGPDGRPAAWNLDHIVISARGVFVIDTKNYSARSVQPSNRSTFTKKNVSQAHRNAVEMKSKLKAWSAGALADVFVVPIIVYVQDGAYVECPREGDVHVIPLKWLESEITQRHPRRPVSADETVRIANVLFSQLELHIQEQFRAEFVRFGTTVRAQAPALDATPTTEQPLPAPSPAPSRPPSCPSCGGTLVERIARKGARAGKPFLGCSNFRSNNCRYVFNLEE